MKHAPVPVWLLAWLCASGVACGEDAAPGPPGPCSYPAPKAVRGLSAGERFSLAVLDNGDSRFWGQVLSYTGGDGQPRQKLVAPLPIETGCHKTVEIAAGWSHACVRFDSGEVRCWGSNGAGQLGITGDLADRREPATPASLGAGRRAVALAAGFDRTCVQLDDGQLRCFGRAVLDGQSGNELIPFGDGRKVTAVGLGDGHTCAVLDRGELRCWGSNDEGELGLGDTAARTRPAEAVDLGAGRTAVEVAAGFHFTCVRLDSGEVKCWGQNREGQLGLGDTTPRPSPAATVDLGAGRTAVQIAAGYFFACARLDDGTVKCWGDNASGQLGLGDSEPHPAPTRAVDLGGGGKIAEIAAGPIHVCARLESGAVKCWGDNDGRQLGILDPLSRGGRPDELGDNLPIVPLGD